MNNRKSREIRKAVKEAAAQTGLVAGTALGAVVEYARKIEQKAEGLEAAVTALEARMAALEARNG